MRQLPTGAAMHHRLIDSQRITRSNVASIRLIRTKLPFPPPPTSVSSVRPISPPLFFSLFVSPPPPSPQTAKLRSFSRVLFDADFFSFPFSPLPSPPPSIASTDDASEANRIRTPPFPFIPNCLLSAIVGDNRSIIVGYGWVERGEGWRGVEKRSREGIRIISDYNLLYGDHQRYRTRSRVEEGCVGKRCVGSRFLFKPFQTAMLSSRFSFFFFFFLRSSPRNLPSPSMNAPHSTSTSGQLP